LDHYGGSYDYFKKFQGRPKKILFLKSYMTLKYLLIIDFPKFDPLTVAEMAHVEILGQNVKIYSP
jgi:hypothetical protein